jgi:hypothetical protein
MPGSRVAVEQSETAHARPMGLSPMIRLVNAWRTGQTGRSSNVVQFSWAVPCGRPGLLSGALPTL